MKAIDDILQQEGYPDLVMLQVCPPRTLRCLMHAGVCRSISTALQPTSHNTSPLCTCNVCMLRQEVTHSIVALFEQMGWFRLYHCSPVPQQVSLRALQLTLWVSA